LDSAQEKIAMNRNTLRTILFIRELHHAKRTQWCRAAEKPNSIPAVATICAKTFQMIAMCRSPRALAPIGGSQIMSRTTPASTVAVRAASQADAAAMGAVWSASWRETYAGLIPNHPLIAETPERATRRWQSRLASKSASEIILVAHDARAGVVALGSAGACTDDGLRSGAATGWRYDGEIFTLYVDPAYTGRGIGRLLLWSLFERLEAQGMASAAVWVLARNPATFFYQAAGAARIASRVDRIFGTHLEVSAFGWPDLREARARTAGMDRGLA
jgi:GNAT superfamily N-acetyltransferase